MQQTTRRFNVNRKSKFLLWLSIAVVTGFMNTGIAQEEDDTAEAESPRDKVVRLSGSSGLTGLRTISPETWGMIQAKMDNPTEEEQTVRLLFQFSDFPERQFLREVSLPRRASRVGEMPVRPGSFPADSPSIDTELILFPGGKETELDRAPGTALVNKEQMTFAVVTDSEMMNARDEAVDDEAVSTLMAVRAQQGLGPGMGYMTLREMPRFDIAWDAAELAAITVDNPFFDAAQRRAIRRWVSRGGKLVVFLDQVDNDAMTQILGEAWDIGVVDKVTLTEIRFEESSRASDAAQSYDLAGGDRAFDARMETEDPIGMTRIIAPGWAEHLTVRGWPAVVSKRLGRGELIAITVGGRAWTVSPIKRQEGDKQIVDDPGTEAALIRLTELLIPTSGAGGEPVSPSESVSGEPGRNYVSQLVGYKIVSRPMVAGVMGLFFIVLVGCGFYWNKKGVGERLGVVGIVAAVVAATTLVVVGQQRRTEVEPTAASVQLVELQPGLSSAHVTGVVGAYHPAPVKVTISGTSGGWLWPITLTQGTDTQRLYTADLDRWSWSDVNIKAGSTRPLQVSVDVQTTRPMRGSFRYGPQGLAGVVDWPEKDAVEDLLLATPLANLRVHTTAEEGQTKLTIGPRDILPEGVFFSDNILTQAQQDRAEMLRMMFKKSSDSERMSMAASSAAGPVFFEQPTLLGWTKGYDLALSVEPSLKRNDQALLAAPLRIDPSDPGDKVHVPWPMIPMQQVKQTSAKELLGLTLMPLYNPQKREWISNQMPSAFIGRFMLPPQVLPLKLTGAKLHLGITAVQRPVRIMAIREGKVEELLVLQGPDSSLELDLPAEKLHVDADGGILLAFDVQDEAWQEFRDMDADRNDGLSKEEFQTAKPDQAAAFQIMDKDGDGSLDLEEYRSNPKSNARATAASKSMSAMWQVHHFGLEITGEVREQQ